MARPRKEAAKVEVKQTGYTPKDKDKLVVHARIAKPPLFDENTGKPFGRDFIQMFNKGVEWQEFVLRPQGYIIMEVLYLPDGAKTVDEILAK